MTKTLKTRAINGMFWSFIDNFAVQLSQFIIGIILARILAPNDFGLIGMLTIFISISQWFVSSGFGQALIRKKDCTQNDYSTVFIFNILAGLLLYLVLFFSSGFISDFFNEPQLESLLNVLGISLIIIAFTIIQQTQLTKRLDFKLQTRISVISAVISGVIGIILAYLGYGVWSLVYKSLLEYFIRSILLWIYNKWRPSLIFDTNSFKELFGFGYKLMLRGLVYTLFNNLYYVVIGKYFSTADLGYYTRAEQFNRMPSTNINKVINRVSYPVLSELQNDDIALKAAYKKIFISLVFISSVSMLILGAIAEPLILTLIGEKWLPTVPMLQLLCFVGLLYPLCDFNLTILKVKGKSGLILKLEIIKRILSIPVIIVGIKYGINSLIIAMIVLSVFEFLINAYFSGKEIAYTLKEQILNNLPSIFLAFVVSTVIYYLSLSLKLNNLLILLICLTLAMILVVLLSELFKIKAYLNIKNIVLDSLKNEKLNQINTKMKISVIIPAYNVEKYIERSINSVLNQTCNPFEIIIVDDGSTDNTAKIIKEYADIIYYYKKNGGEASARNFGIQKAQGDWIAWLDSDDEWLPNHLENFINILFKNPFLKWYGAPANSFNESNGKIIKKYRRYPKDKLIDNSYFKDYMNAIPPYAFFCSDTFIINKEVFEKVGFFDESKKVGCDLDMWFRIALDYPEIGFSHKVGANIFRRETSVSFTTEKPFTNAINRFLESERIAKDKGELFMKRAEPRIIYWVIRLLKGSIITQDLDALKEIKKIYYYRLPIKYRIILLLGIYTPFLFHFVKSFRK